LPPDDSLLGIYRGDSLMNRSVTSPPVYPDTIFIFQKPLEAICADMEGLQEQIAITVVHEIAHYLGMDEERLREMGYE
jgi:predicted Zn-dependent protease with MMP-like domain